MDSELREQFFSTIVHFRKLESILSSECEMQMNEMVILQSIAGTCCRECPCMNLDVPKMQKKLNISKPAISYILNTLEKKNYITREIDAKDRRKVSISATPEKFQFSRHFFNLRIISNRLSPAAKTATLVYHSRSSRS